MDSKVLRLKSGNVFLCQVPIERKIIYFERTLERVSLSRNNENHIK